MIVPLLIMAVSVLVDVIVTSDGVVMVVVSKIVVDSTRVLVTVPRSRTAEQYDTSAWRSSVTLARFPQPGDDCAMATAAIAREKREREDILMRKGKEWM